MSAIWGFINLNKEREEEFWANKAGLMLKMDNAMQQIRFEHVNHSTLGGAFFACGQSFYTPEAFDEILPYCDDSQNLLFTADAFLDNREELLSKLAYRTELQSEMVLGNLTIHKKPLTDSELMRRAYLTWGEDCVRFMRGAYTAVFCDCNKQQVFLFNDHCGNRCLYYTVWNGLFVFSTLLAPILALYKPAYNEKWFAFCELFSTTEMFYDEGSTPYEGIFMLPPGCCGTIDMNAVRGRMSGNANRKMPESVAKATWLHSDGMSCDNGKYSGTDGIVNIRKYWNPIEIARKLGEIKGTPDELKTLFVDTVRKAVEDCLRSAGETGVTLSSGLDSSAVASFAARKLNESGKKLYSFTSVPLPDFTYESGSFEVADESKGIEPICKMYENIVPTFVNCEGKSALSELERFVRISEMPCKSNFNLVWIDDIYQKASERGIKLMLKGQYGNSTFSYGAVLSSTLQLIQKLRFRRAYDTIHQFKARMRVTKKHVLKVISQEIKERMNVRKMIADRAYINPVLEKKYHSVRISASDANKSGGSVCDSRKQYENFVYAPIPYEMLGLFDTKLSLEHNLIVRDPAKDIRVIELCLRMPPDFFVQNGIERYGIRGCMEGIVPKEVRLDINHRGLQSADLMFRTNKALKDEKTREMVVKALEDDALKPYVSEERLADLKEKAKTGEVPDYSDVVDMVNIVALEKFLRKQKDAEIA